MLGSATKLQTKRNIKLQGAVSGNADFDGSGNVTINTTQSNIAVLSGSFDVEATTYGKTTINYPSGFTVDNCVLISLGIYAYTKNGYNYYGQMSEFTSDIGYSSLNRKINLDSTGIILQAENKATSSKTITYKIVLMKIS